MTVQDFTGTCELRHSRQTLCYVLQPYTIAPVDLAGRGSSHAAMFNLALVADGCGAGGKASKSLDATGGKGKRRGAAVGEKMVFCNAMEMQLASSYVARAFEAGAGPKVTPFAAWSCCSSRSTPLWRSNESR